MELSDGFHRVLEPLVAVGHRVVRRLEEAEVPARLRKVRATSARRLPRPLAKALLAAMDESEWLRAKVLEEATDLDRLGRLFLERPTGWDEEIARAVAEEDVARLEALLREADREREAAERTALSLKEKHKGTAERLKTLQAALRSEKATRADAVRAAEQRIERAAHDEIARLRSELEDASAAATELARVRRRLAWFVAARDKRQVDDRGREAVTAHWSGDPLEKARLLDEIVVASSSATDGRPSIDEPSHAAPFGLPPGMRPDDPAAVDVVLRHPHPLTIALDGYNVAAGSGISLERQAEARRFVLDLAERLAQRARHHTVWAVFDSDLGSEAKGVAVYVPHADDELRRLATEVAGAVVITDDREVIEDATRVGAVALWASALVEWAQPA